MMWAEKAARGVRDALLAVWGEGSGQGHLALSWRLRGVDGWLTRREMAALYKSVLAAPNEGDVLEFGSWKGRSTVVIALALRQLRGKAVVHAVDPHEGIHYVAASDSQKDKGPTLAAFRRNVGGAGVADLVAAMVMRSGEAVSLLAKKGVRLRLAFVDGVHTEAAVREDLALVLPLLVPGGLVAFHDCSPESVHTDVWKVWQEDLAGRAEVVAQADTLLVARPL